MPPSPAPARNRRTPALRVRGAAGVAATLPGVLAAPAAARGEADAPTALCGGRNALDGRDPGGVDGSPLGRAVPA